MKICWHISKNKSSDSSENKKDRRNKMLENQKLFDEQYQKLSNKVGILKVELKHLESKIKYHPQPIIPLSY
jgi:hypothetical protein